MSNNYLWHIFGTELGFSRDQLCGLKNTIIKGMSEPQNLPKACLLKHDLPVHAFWGLFSSSFLGLDGQNRQSPIASDFGSRTQIAALFEFCCIGMFKTNRQSRVSNRSFESQGRQRFESRVFKSLAILDLDRAISPI